jgi:L-ascorbate oxidase
VNSLIISAGERYDFIITTNQAISSYWIRLHGLMDCKNNEVFQAAILQYEGATDDEPSEELTYENTIRSGKVELRIKLLNLTSSQKKTHVIKGF